MGLFWGALVCLFLFDAMIGAASGLSGTCYPYTEKIVDECSTDHIYLAALSHNIRNKKCLKNIFFKACPY